MLDVREDHEYERGHVPGVTWIPLGELADRLAEVPEGAGPVYVICASGNRSRTAARILESSGRAAVSVAGGTRAWMSAGHPVARGHSA